MAANWSTTVVHATVQDIGPAITAAVSVWLNFVINCYIPSISLLFRTMPTCEWAHSFQLSHRYFPHAFARMGGRPTWVCVQSII